MIRRFFAHVIRILDTIYSGSISLIFKCVLSIYLINIFLLFALAICSYVILNGVLNFFKPLKLKPGSRANTINGP